MQSIYILNHKVYKIYIKVDFSYVDDTFIFFIRINKQKEVMVNNLNKCNLKNPIYTCKYK